MLFPPICQVQPTVSPGDPPLSRVHGLNICSVPPPASPYRNWIASATGLHLRYCNPTAHAIELLKQTNCDKRFRKKHFPFVGGRVGSGGSPTKRNSSLAENRVIHLI